MRKPFIEFNCCKWCQIFHRSSVIFWCVNTAVFIVFFFYSASNYTEKHARLSSICYPLGEQNQLHHAITISLLRCGGSIKRTSKLLFGKERWKNCHRSSVFDSSHYILKIYFVVCHLVPLTLSY